MASTNATLVLSSSDLTSNDLSLRVATTLKKAGTNTGLTNTTGVSRKTTSYGSSGAIEATVLFRGDDYTSNGANKVYLRNMSEIATEYFTVYLTGDRGGETHTPANALTEIGRLYAGDFAFFPWNAVAGTKEIMTCQITGTWAAGDSIKFDGVEIISAGSGKNELAAAMDAAHYPNWTTSVSTDTVTFTARHSRADIEIDDSEFAIVDLAGSNATITVGTSTPGTKSASDIYILPSVHTDMTLEYLLIHE